MKAADVAALEVQHLAYRAMAEVAEAYDLIAKSHMTAKACE
jgi:hypothetical protein